MSLLEPPDGRTPKYLDRPLTPAERQRIYVARKKGLLARPHKTYSEATVIEALRKARLSAQVFGRVCRALGIPQ
jgi:hypothetical protein